MNIWRVVSWVVTLCSSETAWCLRETYPLLLQSWRTSQARTQWALLAACFALVQKFWVLFESRSITTQKTVLFIATVMGTSNPTKLTYAHLHLYVYCSFHNILYISDERLSLLFCIKITQSNLGSKTGYPEDLPWLPQSLHMNTRSFELGHGNMVSTS
jgi:hypothetical protein